MCSNHYIINSGHAIFLALKHKINLNSEIIGYSVKFRWAAIPQCLKITVYLLKIVGYFTQIFTPLIASSDALKLYLPYIFRYIGDSKQCKPRSLFVPHPAVFRHINM